MGEKKRQDYKSFLCSIPTVKFWTIQPLYYFKHEDRDIFLADIFLMTKGSRPTGISTRGLWRNVRRLSHADKSDLKIKESCRVFPGLDSLGFRRLVEWLSRLMLQYTNKSFLLPLFGNKREFQCSLWIFKCFVQMSKIKKTRDVWHHTAHINRFSKRLF